MSPSEWSTDSESGSDAPSLVIEEEDSPPKPACSTCSNALPENEEEDSDQVPSAQLYGRPDVFHSVVSDLIARLDAAAQ